MTDGPRGERLFRAWYAEPPPSFDEAAARARFLERMGGQRGFGPRAYVLAAAAAVFVVTGALLGSRATSRVTFATGSGQGQAGAWLSTSGSDDLALTFSEGSRLEMAAGSRGRVEELRREGASFLLERGHIHARVTHRSTTDWRFLAGPFEVRVTGTALAVDWDPARERFAVSVENGAVAVRGPNLADAQVLVSGQELAVDLPLHTSRVGPLQTAAPEATGEPPLPPAADHDNPGGAAPAPPRRASPRGAPAPAALSILRTASGDELLRVAQDARLSGHADAEREALVTCRRRFPGSESASIAAYELGRASSPSEASSWFETYLGERPSGPLAREAAGRLVETRAAAGDDRGARDAATRYLARYPDGPHAALARSVLAGGRE